MRGNLQKRNAVVREVAWFQFHDGQCLGSSAELRLVNYCYRSWVAETDTLVTPASIRPFLKFSLVKVQDSLENGFDTIPVDFMLAEVSNSTGNAVSFGGRRGFLVMVSLRGSC